MLSVKKEKWEVAFYIYQQLETYIIHYKYDTCAVQLLYRAFS
jgi:hypothetical protein